mgnify:CR=1 FL=1
MSEINIRNEIKAEIAKSGWTLTDIVKEMNRLHPEETTTSQNISNKLTRGTLKYSEALEIANITGRKIIWMPITETE